MKTLKFDTTSWHYRLARYHSGYVEDNICDYSKQVLMGLMRSIYLWGSLFIGVIITSKILAELVLGIWFSAVTGMNMMSSTGSVALTMVICLSITIIVVLGCTKVGDLLHERSCRKANERYHREPKPVKEDGFLKAAYKSIRGKYCAKIEFGTGK
jgi:hypothetical protein